MDNSDDENDCVPSTSRGVISPAASIQSNKVDSSGLNATPPHNRYELVHFFLFLLSYEKNMVMKFMTIYIYLPINSGSKGGDNGQLIQIKSFR